MTGILGNTTVYIVDDDDGVRDSLKLLLESYSFAVEAFGSTAALLRGYRPNSHACLVLDQHLPGATGLDFLASSEGARLNLPVILVTVRGNAALRKRALEAGVAAYFEKPVDGGALITAIERAVADGRTG